jgi:hypothetical protein
MRDKYKGWLWGDGHGGGEVYCLSCGYDSDFHMNFAEDIDPTYLFKIDEHDEEFTRCDICGRELTEVE